MSILENNKFYFSHVGIRQYHKAGIKGKGKKILVIDHNFPINKTHLKGRVIPASEMSGKSWHISDGRESTHGLLSCSLANQIVPEARMYFYQSGNMARAIQFAIDNKIDVVTMSMGYDWNNPSLDDVAKKAKENGIILFAAAGNDGNSGLLNPANNDEFIAVGAAYIDLMKSTYGRANYSAIGENLEVMGLTGRWTTTRNGVNVQYTGTSCACPVVASMCVLTLQKMGSMNMDEFRELISTHSANMDVEGRDIRTGYGLYKLPSLKNGKPMKVISLLVDRTQASINGVRNDLDQPPIIDSNSNRTLVPLSFIARQLGHNVVWDGDARTVTIDNKIILTIDSNIAKVNGKNLKIDQAPIIENSRTMVPLSFIARQLGYYVEWQENARAICISN